MISCSSLGSSVTTLVVSLAGKNLLEISAKKELGANVVVMNVRNVKRKGLFDFLKQ